MGNIETAKDLGQGIYTKEETTEIVEAHSNLNTVASCVLLNKDSLALEDYAVTKNFATVLYTGNGSSQDITTGISSVDFTTSGNGSGYWLDRSTFEVKTDAGDAVASGECVVNTSKVHVKQRSGAAWNSVWDSLRGGSYRISTNHVQAEDNRSGFMNVNINGLSITSSDANSNKNSETYVAYQTLYTHIKWGTTNQSKKYIEAFNPVTRETMIMYEGSGDAGHEIPHSLSVELAYSVVKSLSTATSWRTNTHGLRGELNADVVFVVDGELIQNENNVTVSGNLEWNKDADVFILYGKAKSENWTIVEYNGTGAAGNFVETKDVYGVPRKPARVIIKRIDDTGSWIVWDNKRDNSALWLDLYNASTTYSDFTVNSQGFTLNGSSTNTIYEYNTANGQYIALVEFDTNTDGGDGYFNKPTDDSNLNLTDGVFIYTDGKGSNGYVRSTESLAGTTTIDFAGVNDGKHWVAKVKDGGYLFRVTKPTYDLDTTRWIGETGVLSFLPNPIMVTSETPQYIDYSEELATNVMESLEVSNTIKCDNYLGKNACTAWVNFDGTTTPPTIRDSFNVKDVVKTATGEYNIHTLDKINLNACAVSNASSNNNGRRISSAYIKDNNTIFVTISNSDATAVNYPYVTLQIFGGKE